MPTTLRPIVILGPTAGGKSELAVALAEHLHGEVIGADSMQVYRRLDAGTAKPEPELRARAPHHLIDIVDPTDRFTAADWLTRADALIHQLQQVGRRPIVVGGTNLYLKVLLEGMFDAPPQDDAFRDDLQNVPPQELHRRLQQVDPDAAERIHPNNHKRLVRALEVHHLTGQPISAHQQQWTLDPDQPSGVRYRHDPILIGLHWSPERINQRINARVRMMFFPTACGLAKGEPSPESPPESLPDEVRRLEAEGVLGPQAREALGYKQVLEHLADPGRVTLEDAFERTKVLTRRFAKQQRTWLRRYRGVHWLDADAATPADLTAKALEGIADR